MSISGMIQLQEKNLSPRECEVVQFLTRGYRNQEIAAALGIKERTVRFHVGNILQKLNAKNRTEVAYRLFHQV